MGKSRHLTFSGQVSVSAGAIYCGHLTWAPLAISLYKRDHYGSKSTSVWIEQYEMAVFGSADTTLAIMTEVCGRRVEQMQGKLLRKTSASQLKPEDNEVICPITYT